MTEYKDIEGYPGYKIGNDGTVLSNHRWRRDSQGNHLGDWYALKGSIDRCGYNIVVLYNGAYTKRIFAHVLVLQAFKGPCPWNMVAAHKDGNPSNNNIDNLRWTTQKDNLADRKIHGTLMLGEKNHNSKMNDDLVRQIRNKYYNGETVQNIAKEFKVNVSTISRIVKYETWKHVKRIL